MSACPVCAKPGQERFKPFCSRRCADLDLGQWLKGGYVVPGEPVGPASPSNSGENDPDED